MSSRGRLIAEMAVIAGIVLLVAGLVLPAVMKVRDAAERMKCQGNVKQLVFGLHNYDSSYGYFPVGTIANPQFPSERRLSWCVSIVPFLESGNVYRQFDLTAPADVAQNRAAGDSLFSYFVCPASPDVDDNGRAKAPVMYYVGMAGVGADAAVLPADDPRAGVFGYDRRTLYADITDGPANTIALLEISRDPGRWAVGGPGTVRGLDPADAPHVGRWRSFGGLHPYTRSFLGAGKYAATVGMADGSVRVLPETTTAAVVEALATAAGKETLPEE